MQEILSHQVRRLWPSDLTQFRDHLIRLDPKTRHDRFGLAVADTFLESYAERCFGFGTLTYGYVQDGLIRGAAELHTITGHVPPRITGAEAAFSVEAAWRRRGIGAELMGRVIRAARNRRVPSLSIFCLPANTPMLRLAKKFEAELVFYADDVTGRLVARPPSATSLWSEFLGESMDFAASVFDAQTRLLAPATAGWRLPG